MFIIFRIALIRIAIAILGGIEYLHLNGLLAAVVVVVVLVDRVVADLSLNGSFWLIYRYLLQYFQIFIGTAGSQSIMMLASIRSNHHIVVAGQVPEGSIVEEVFGQDNSNSFGLFHQKSGKNTSYNSYTQRNEESSCLIACLFAA